MEYQEFLCVVEKKMNQKLEGGVTASIQIAVKNNGRIKKGIMIENPAVNISPTIYLEEFYEQFQQGEPLDNIIRSVINFYESVKYEEPWDIKKIECYQEVRDKIVFKVIHTKRNQEMLRCVPHIGMLDLSIVFYVLLEAEKNGTAVILVRNEHLEYWGIEKEVLFPLACGNAKRLLEASLMTMRETVEEILDPGCEIPHNLLKESVDAGIKTEGKDVMYILTNTIRSFGAACMLYPEVLETAGKVLEENYYILPSSVHEVILVPESQSPDPEKMTAMIRSVNETQVEEEDQLSDHAYYYDRRKKQMISSF